MPILEKIEPDGFGLTSIVPRAPNADFCASILDPKGDQGVVYIPRQLSFYIRDAKTTTYRPLAAEDLMLQLSQEFLQCAQAMPGNVEVEPLFTKCRGPRMLNQIVQRARIVLKVPNEFLDEQGRMVNESSLTPLQRASMFAEQYLKPVDGAVLALSGCDAGYRRFCEAKGWRTPVIRDFTKSINLAVHKIYAMSLRHDMSRISQMSRWGWRGLQMESN